MKRKRTGGPPRRFWARICALAVIAAMLLTGVAALTAPESGLATENLAAENLAPQSAAQEEENTSAPAQAAAAPRVAPSTVKTEDTLSKGVNINLFDYTEIDVNTLYKYNRNNYWFAFKDDEDYSPLKWNWYTGTNGGVYQGIVENELKDSFPVLAQYGRNQTGSGTSTAPPNLHRSLNKIYDPAITEQRGSNVAKTYTEVNYLFQLDNEGYYYYDSEKNFASIKTDREGNHYFNVYRVPYKENATAPSDPKFLPFNDLNDQRGDSLRGNANFHFGMTMDFTFLQPKDGQVTNQDGEQKDMVFEFRGDDDVWLFIDGVLVMDIGGIHDAYEGSVNFATGEVRVQNRVGNANGSWDDEWIETTLYELMLDAKGQIWCNENFVKNDAGQMTFKDYTTHTFNYYYLERGAGGSNCKIKFNLQSIPDDTIYVQKLIDNSPFEDFADAQFKFKVEVSKLDGNGNALFGKDNLTPYKGYYQVWHGVVGEQGATKVGEPQYTNDGTFLLQHYQYAQLLPEYKTEKAVTPIKANSDFRVAEIDAYSDHYIVDVNGAEAEWQDDEGNKGSYLSDVLNRVDAASVIFRNTVKEDTSSMFQLKIEKKLENGTSEDKYPVQIKIGGKLYAKATYYRYDASGYLDSTPYTTDDDGIATIPAGGAIALQQIPWTTSFEITEVLPNDIKDQYEAPEYEVVNADHISTDGSASGRIPEDKTDEGTTTTVTITNSLKSADFTFTKVDAADPDKMLPGAKFELWPATVTGEGADAVWEKKEGAEAITPIYPTGDRSTGTGEDGKARFKDIPFGNYLLYEVKAPAGYKLPTDPVRVTVEPDKVTFMNVDDGTFTEIELPKGDVEDTSGEAATIPNKEQDELPVAGGMGAIWFTAGGLVLVGAAALLYFKQRKKGRE